MPTAAGSIGRRLRHRDEQHGQRQQHRRGRTPTAAGSAGLDITVTNSTVSGNSTAGDYAGGGGIYGVRRHRDEQHGQRQQHRRDYAVGGGIYSAYAITLTNSTVSGNSTAGWRRDYGEDITLTNSTVSGNSTAGTTATAAESAVSAVTLTNSTVSGNSTAGEADGGGIFGDYITADEQHRERQQHRRGLRRRSAGSVDSRATWPHCDEQHGQRQQHHGRLRRAAGSRLHVTVRNSTVSGNAPQEFC